MPVITISRMFGVGGSEIADLVARELGWKLLDNAFIEGVAGRLGTTPAHVESIEERVPTLAERIADALTFGSPEMVSASLTTPMPPTEERVFEVTRRMIDETLEFREDALHVLCCAQLETMVARVAAREGIPREQAEALVREKNHQREQYVKRHWGRQWLAPEHYHLCLNTGWLGIEVAAELIIRVAVARFGLGS
jgi:cytidylate kinase